MSEPSSAVAAVNFRRTVLLVVIAVAFVATLLAWYFETANGTSTPIWAKVQAVTCVVLVGLFVLGWLRALPQRAIELACLVYIVVVCAACMAIAMYVYGNRAGAYLEPLYLWIPLVYVFAFMLVSHKAGLVLSAVIFAVFLGISLPFVAHHPEGRYVNYTVQLHIASAVMIVMLYFFTSYQHRLRLAQQAADQFAHLSNTDELTGLPNRRRMAALITAELQPAAVRRDGFALLLFDIDHFKAVNDQFGHLGGDDTLVALAARTSEFFRGVGTLGRWGGDEFLAVVHGVDATSVARMAEALCLHVAAEPLAQGKGVTISCGVTVMRTGDNIDNLLQRADAALYAAKRGGRNRATSVLDPMSDGAPV